MDITRNTRLNSILNLEDYEIVEGPRNAFGEYVGRWIDAGDVWLNVSEQGTEEWKNARKGRITASDFGTAAGVSKFKDRETLLLEKKLDIEPEFSEESLAHMKRGTDNEPVARDLYIKLMKVDVIERGLIVPKWNPLIGASVDGDIVDSDGCLEIKCPKYIYKTYKDRTYNKSSSGNDYIFRTHYCQMQGGCAILGKKWFHYVVYGVSEKKIMIDKVPFNVSYWCNFLYPKLESFCQELSS